MAASSSVAAARRLVVVIGCTGTGKSKLAIELAKKFSGEIVSADSMQVYLGLDVITNKVTLEEMQGVPHHLLSYLSPLTLGTTVKQFRQKALAVMEDIWARDRLPILVGGTSYYIESVLWNILINEKNHKDNASPSEDCSSSSDEDDQVEDDEPGILTHIARGLPPHLCSADKDVLYQELLKVDPERAKRLHPHDSRRVMRSLQIWYSQGVKHSSLIDLKADRSGVRLGGNLRFPNTCVFLIKCSKEVLNERLDLRIGSMVEAGLKEEIETFYKDNYQKYLELKNAAVEKVHGMEGFKGVFQSIGLKEFQPYLALPADERNSDLGQRIFNRCCTDLNYATRKYARKQTRRITQSFMRMHGRQKLPVYAVDSSDVSAWDALVRIPAEAVLDDFLNDRSPITGIEPLRNDDKSDRNLDNLTKKCEECDRYIHGEKQWLAHLKSKGHRYFIKKRASKLALLGELGEEEMMSEDGILVKNILDGMTSVPS